MVAAVKELCTYILERGYFEDACNPWRCLSQNKWFKAVFSLVLPLKPFISHPQRPEQRFSLMSNHENVPSRMSRKQSIIYPYLKKIRWPEGGPQENVGKSTLSVDTLCMKLTVRGAQPGTSNSPRALKHSVAGTSPSVNEDLAKEIVHPSSFFLHNCWFQTPNRGWESHSPCQHLKEPHLDSCSLHAFAILQKGITNWEKLCRSRPAKTEHFPCDKRPKTGRLV